MSRSTNRVVDVLTRNWGWRLGALLLAILLWIATVGQPELVTMHSVPIVYKDLPGDFVIGSDAVDVVRLELRGPATKLTTANLADLVVSLDLSDVKLTGERTFTVSGAAVHLPPGVTFQRAVPAQLRVAFSRRISKEIPIAIQIGADPPAGYKAVKMEVVPQTVLIAGPEFRVATITGAKTDAIDLSGTTATKEFQVNTYVADSHVWMESPSLVTVKITIEKN